MIACCLAGNAIHRRELRLVRDSGGEIAAIVSMVPIPEGVLVAVLDHTERTQLDALFALRGRLQRATSFDELSAGAFDAIEETLGIERASIQLFDPEGATKFVTRRGLSDGYVAIIQSRWRSTFDPANPTTFVSSDIAKDEREPLWQDVVNEGIRALISIPLVAQSRLLGKFVVYDTSPRQFTRDEIELAETIANNVAFAIDRMQSEVALREGMSQLELALRASNTGTWSHEFETDKVLWDDRTHRLFGLEPGTFEGNIEAFLSRVHPDDRARIHVGDSVEEEFVHTVRVVHSDGTIRHLRSRGRMLHAPDGRPIGVAGVAQDVTEELQLEEEKRRLFEKIQQSQKLESLGVLAGGIAHDFNNLLVGILGTVDLVRAQMRSGPSLQEALGYIETAAQRAASLAQQMLAYSGRGRVVVQAIDISDLVEEMAQLLGTVISKKAEMTLDLARDLPMVEGDPTQIRQVIMNLITNASDALDGRTGSIVLRTGLRTVAQSELDGAVVGEDLPGGEYAVIEVSDDGCGMEKGTIPKIFEPFFSTKFTGRGLGLAAVLGIVRSHRGAIVVRSELGRGTTFSIVLPPSSRAPEVKPPPPAAVSHVGGATILIVDDEVLVRNITSRILATAGFEVLSAADGPDAIRQLSARAAEIDLVIIDMTMPRMSGDEVLREMRQLVPHLRAILTSGFADVAEGYAIPRDPRSFFISKPYTAASLVAKVKTALAQD